MAIPAAASQPVLCQAFLEEVSGADGAVGGLRAASAYALQKG